MVIIQRSSPPAAESPYAKFASRQVIANLFESDYDALVRTAALMVGSHEQAEEIVQESFVQLLQRQSSVDEPSHYLWRSVTNRARDALRRVAVERRFAPILRSSRTVDSAPNELFDALDRLPSRQRVAVVLRYYAGFTGPEIANAMKCPAGTVKTHLHRGLERLRRELDE